MMRHQTKDSLHTPPSRDTDSIRPKVFWSGRRRGLTIAFLSSLAVVLALANLIEHELLTWKILKSHKEALDAASSGLGIIVVFVGAILSYFRFFHGRTLSTRAELGLAVRIYLLPNGRLLHTIDLALKNIGGTAIWNPRPFVSMTTTGAEGDKPGGTICTWFDLPQNTDNILRVSVADTGETVHFVAKRDFDPDVWTVTYFATVTCDSGDVWNAIQIVRSAPTHPEHD